MRIVFSCGVFDCLHDGHEFFLKRAREMGDYLIIAVNTDASTKRLKGEERPIDGLERRLRRIRHWCQAAFPFEGDPYPLLEAIRPAIYVKGDDWTRDKLIGAHFVESYGGQVVRIPRLPNVSTTRILAERARSTDA